MPAGHHHDANAVDLLTSDAALALDRHGRYPVPGKGVWILGLLAGLFLAAAIVSFVLGP